MKRILIISLLIVSCTTQKPSNQLSLPNIATFENIDTLWIPIKLEPSYQNIRKYAFPNDGITESIMATGTHVTTGQILAQQSTAEIQNKIKLQQIILIEAEKKLKRTKQLYSQQARTEVQKEEDEVRVKIEQAKLEQLRTELKTNTIRSKNSGEVLRSSVQGGEFSRKGETVIVLGEGEYSLEGKITPIPSFDSDSIQIVYHGLKGIVQTKKLAPTKYADTAEFKIPVSPKLRSTVGTIPITSNVAQLSAPNTFHKNEIIRIAFENGKVITAVILRCSPNALWVKYFGARISDGNVREISY